MKSGIVAQASVRTGLDPCRVRFMESEHLQELDVSWGHEPGHQRAADVPSADRFQNRRQDAGSTLKLMGSRAPPNLPPTSHCPELLFPPGETMLHWIHG